MYNYIIFQSHYNVRSTPPVTPTEAIKHSTLHVWYPPPPLHVSDSMHVPEEALVLNTYNLSFFNQF